jgi:hypothetical protein
MLVRVVSLMETSAAVRVSRSESKALAVEIGTG